MQEQLQRLEASANQRVTKTTLKQVTEIKPAVNRDEMVDELVTSSAKQASLIDDLNARLQPVEHQLSATLSDVAGTIQQAAADADSRVQRGVADLTKQIDERLAGFAAEFDGRLERLG